MTDNAFDDDEARGVRPEDYTHPDHQRFVRDMQDSCAGELMHYKGRWFWEGPAVSVDDVQDALGCTKVPCQWETLGMGYVVYPRAK